MNAHLAKIREIAALKRQLDEAKAEVKRITDMLSDSATVHANIMRGTIKISKANLIHAAGLPANIEEQLAEARKAAGWTPITPENLPRKGDEVGYWSKSGEFVVCSIWNSRNLTYKQWKYEGWKYLRSINPPAQEPKP
jgi:hypothetical protein